MSDFIKFRNQYPEFVFNSYELTENSETINIRYNFEIKGLSSFSPEWKIKKCSPENITDDIKLQKLVFSLGMVELVSYWKITCSPRVSVLCGTLDEKQIRWWKTQYFNGLGEFFYRNGINTDFDSFMQISTADNIVYEGSDTSRSLEGCLIPVGGGKDSIVTLELLKETHDKNCYICRKTFFIGYMCVDIKHYSYPLALYTESIFKMFKKTILFLNSHQRSHFTFQRS